MIQQLRLNTLENCRKSYNRIIRDYLAGGMDTETGRAVAYMLNGLLQYWRLEKDIEIERRLEAIEQRLHEQKEAGR